MDIRDYLIVNAPPMPVDFRHNDREKYNPPAVDDGFEDYLKSFYERMDDQKIRKAADWAVRYADAVIERMAVK